MPFDKSECPAQKKKKQRALLNSTKESKTHLEQFLVVLMLDYTFTFSFTLSKLVFVSLLLSVKIIYVVLHLLLQYIIPDGKIFILTKLTETFTAKHSEKTSFLNYPVKILEKYPWGNYFSKVAGYKQTVGGWTPS